MADLPTSRPHAATMPVVGISANVRQLADYKFHGTAEKSLHAIFEVAGCLPLMLPSLGSRYDFDDIISRLDGLVLTGSESHVDPYYYGASHEVPPERLDSARDATTLPLIRRALQARVPLLALCRGMQEMNVALGGTLKVMADNTPHRRDASLSLEQWLAGEAHGITLSQDGRLSGLMGATTLQVNSAHEQAIDMLADRLQTEAVADDGVIEAVSLKGGDDAFAIGVQWHPEYNAATHPASRSLFEAFGDAARARLLQRLRTVDWQADLVVVP